MNDFRRSAAPSPETPKRIRPFRLGLPQIPPKLSTESRSRRRYVRIPDFVQLFYEIHVKKDGTLDSPLVQRSGILLLVEIKDISTFVGDFQFSEVLTQTDEQAHHAFASYPKLNAFGLIVAFGDYWTYREYHRGDMRASPTLSDRLDPTFVDSKSESFSDTESNVSISQSRHYADVDEAFGPSGFAGLQSQRSNAALLAVRNRMISLAKAMFDTYCNRSSHFCCHRTKIPKQDCHIFPWLPVMGCILSVEDYTQ